MTEEEKKEKRIQILIGLGITAAAYLIIYLSIRYFRFFWELLGTYSSLVVGIFYFLVAAALVAIGVITTKRGKPYIGRTIGIIFLVTPVLFILLLLGTCGVALSGL